MDHHPKYYAEIYAEILELLENKTREDIEMISFKVTQKAWSMKGITNR